MTETQIISRILRGDVEAFGNLVHHYAPALVGAARHLTRNTEDAEDVAQEALLDAYRHLASLKQPAKFKSWLFGILRHKCLDYLQRRQPETLALEEYTEVIAAPTPAETSELMELLNSLPLADREILAAHYLQGLSYREVAEVLGISEEAARQRCNRVRARLRSLVELRDEERARKLLGVFLSVPIGKELTEKIMQATRKISPPASATTATFHLGTLALVKWQAITLASLLAIGGAIGVICVVWPPAAHRLVAHNRDGRIVQADTRGNAIVSATSLTVEKKDKLHVNFRKPAARQRAHTTGSGMSKPTSKQPGMLREKGHTSTMAQQADEKIILEGIQPISYQTGQLTPFAGSLVSCMKYLGTPVDYNYLLGITGAPFRRQWQRDDGGNIDLMHFYPEPVRRAFEALAYDYQIPPKDGMMQAVVASIGRKHPVLAFGIVGPPECGIIAGYGEHGKVVYGYSYFQQAPGMYEEANWLDKAHRMIIIGDKRPGPMPSQRKIFRASLEWAIQLERLPEWNKNGHVNGLAAYTAWADALEVDADYPKDDVKTMDTRVMVHGDQCTMQMERQQGAAYLRSMRQYAPEAADELTAAADLYDKTALLAHKAWPWEPVYSRAVGIALADSATRHTIAGYIREAQTLETQAVEYLEKALQKIDATPHIETARLLIRPFFKDDWAGVQALALDKESSKGAKYDATWPTTENECKALTAYFAKSDQYYAVVLPNDQQIIGLLAFNSIENKQLDLGHVIHTQYQDNDHDREALAAIIEYAFKSKDISSVITRNAPEWIAQIKPLKSLGLKSVDGKPGELAISKAEWEARRK